MFNNHLIKLLKKEPNKPWDWDGISSNPNITLEIIEKYSDKDWDGMGYQGIQTLLWKS